MKTRIITIIAALFAVVAAMAVNRSICLGSFKLDIHKSGQIISSEIKSGTVHYEDGDGYRRLILDNAEIVTGTRGLFCGVHYLDVIVKGNCSITTNNGIGLYVDSEDAGESSSLSIMGNGTLTVTTKETSAYLKGFYAEWDWQHADPNAQFCEDYPAYLTIEENVTLNLISTDEHTIDAEGKYPEVCVKDNATLNCKAKKHAITGLYHLEAKTTGKIVLKGNDTYATIKDVKGFSYNSSTSEFDIPDYKFVSAMKTVMRNDPYETWRGDIILRPGLEVNKENFPDANFRKYVLSLSGAGDKILLRGELAWITSMNVNDQGIGSLQGIEHFTSLKKLSCDGNSLTSLDVSKNTELQTLNCSFNELTALDVSANKKLKTLQCYRNKIKTGEMLNLVLSLPDNGIEDRSFTPVSNYSDEENVCDRSRVRGATSRGWTVYYESANTGMMTPFEGSTCVSVNETTFPDANFRNYILEQSYGQDGLLTDFELQKVKIIDVKGKNIASLKGIEHFTELEKLYCNNNALTSLDVSNNTKLALLNCSANKLWKLDLTNNKVLTGLLCYQNKIKSTYMDDLIASLPYNGSDEKLGMLVYYTANTEENVLTTFQAADARAKGWQPYCYDAQNDVWPKYEGSTITGLAIDSKRFPDDNFRSYLLAQNYGRDGLLTTEEILKVTELNVSNQGIASLKGMELFTALTKLQIFDNQIGELEMEYVVKCLEQLGHGGTFYATATTTVDKNYMNIYQSGRAMKCGWTPMQSMLGSWQYFAGYPNQEIAYYFDLSLLKDQNLKDYLLSCDWARNGYITFETMNTITSVDISKRNVTQLGPIVFLTNLRELHCEGNQLQSLDPSAWPKLEALYCNDCGLTSLDLSKNPNLSTLVCYRNELTSLDLSKNTELIALDCRSNHLGSNLNVSNNPRLRHLLCTGCGLDALDLSNCPELRELNCDQNRMGALNVTGATKLMLLSCRSNLLTTLDLSTNTALENLSCYFNYLTTLNLSNNKQLKIIDCESNSLSELNLAGTKVHTVNCAQNDIGPEAMTSLVASLPQTDNGSLNVYDESSNDRNVCTTANVATAMSKGWHVFYYGSLRQEYSYQGTNGVAISKQNFPDEKFLEVVKERSYDKNENNFLTENELAKVTSMNVYHSDIADLTGIEHFTEITRIDCQYNKLTKLDLSNNQQLTFLACYGNMIKGDEMDNLIGSLPWVEDGKFYVCDETWLHDNEINIFQVQEARLKGWSVLKLDANGNSVEYDGEIPAGINDLTVTSSAPRRFYNLNGQRVDRPVKKGLYIVNGRKILMK